MQADCLGQKWHLLLPNPDTGHCSHFNLTDKHSQFCSLPQTDLFPVLLLKNEIQLSEPKLTQLQTTSSSLSTSSTSVV